MIRIMQIGYGYWGHNVAQKLKMSGKFDFKYLVDTDGQKAEMARTDMPDVTVINDYKDKLEDVDAVAICTQTQYSFQIAMDAMDAGKHIFIEKPLAQSVLLAQQLTEKAKKQGLILHCDHLMVYNPVIKYIKKMIDNDEMGDIMYIDISRVNLGPIRKDINAMLDLAVHDIAVIDYLLGSFEPDILNIVGTQFCGKQENITYLTMKSGTTLVSINSSWVSPVKIRRSVIAGTKKMAIFDDVVMDNKLKIYDSGIDVVQGNIYGEYEFKTRVGDVLMPHIDLEDSLLNSLEHFAECIENNRESLSGPTQCMRVMRILERAQNELKKQRSESKKESS
jgi:predicted dehydrogenase